jgi:hypothetical protein
MKPTEAEKQRRNKGEKGGDKKTNREKMGRDNKKMTQKG